MARRSVVIGIAGGSGSGKTTVARNLLEGIAPAGIAMVSQDNYYHDLGHLAMEDRKKTNFDHPDSIDNELLCRHLRDLREGRPIQLPLYNYITHTRREETVELEPAPVIIVEGILVLVDPRLREQMDIKLFVDIDADVRLIRRLNRDVRERGWSLEQVLAQYMDTVRPMHLEFVEPSKRYADVIIPMGGQNNIALEMLRTSVRSFLNPGA